MAEMALHSRFGARNDFLTVVAQHMRLVTVKQEPPFPGSVLVAREIH